MSVIELRSFNPGSVIAGSVAPAPNCGGGATRQTPRGGTIQRKQTPTTRDVMIGQGERPTMRKILKPIIALLMVALLAARAWADEYTDAISVFKKACQRSD